jgi:hypothetical protein
MQEVSGSIPLGSTNFKPSNQTLSLPPFKAMNRLNLFSHICPTQTGSKLSPIR